MSIVYVIFIEELITSDLKLKPKAIKELESKISNIPYNEIIIDFSNIGSMTPDFVNKYKSLLNKSKKIIHEVNIPPHLEKTFNHGMKSY